ncbi:hypothetical protein [Planococcus lenghuensis]|uniref:Uncharacterized protein n=1 Tax=Planococcus lenghuensis TaxID=2213202 RepID=A0A1Q2L4I2_9BACL|nr:hypothetical protein [Planococcus lenghuensis]AQQ55349.1 hypothetical protein B0X71_19440 [Planococcus lenghuensis]
MGEPKGVNTAPPIEESTQVFPKADGTISYWDHPSFKSAHHLPNGKYRPFRSSLQAREWLERSGQYEEIVTLLKVIGDAFCVSEAQLRRYMRKLQSFSQTSKLLEQLRTNDFVQRHQCWLIFKEDAGERKPSNLFVLGTAGHLFIKSSYPRQEFQKPDYWLENSLAAQRYVAANEIRCTGVETKKIRQWAWHPAVGGHPNYKKPLAVLETKENEVTPALQLLIERVQMRQPFLDYLRRRLKTYEYLLNRYGQIKVEGFSRKVAQAVLIHVSSVSMADFIQQQLRPHEYSYDVIYMIDEWFEETRELATSVAASQPEGVIRINFSGF